MNNMYYGFDDILIMPSSISHENTRNQSENILSRTEKTGFGRGYPIIVANMSPIGSFIFAKKFFIPELIFTCIERAKSFEELVNGFDTIEDEHKHLVIPTFGINKEQTDLLTQFLNDYVIPNNYNIHICFDVANGHNLDAITIANDFVSKYPNIKFISGNYANPNVISKMNTHGLCVGIGSGSLCLTRLMTGIGVPQASAIAGFVQSAISTTTVKNQILISDGGIKSPSDVCKALYLGADMVMIGGLFLKTNDVHHYDERSQSFNQYKTNHQTFVHGNSTSIAQEKPPYAISEGKQVRLTSECDKTSISDVIKKIKGGIHSMNTYTDNIISKMSFHRVCNLDEDIRLDAIDIFKNNTYYSILPVSNKEQNNTFLTDSTKEA